MIYHPSASGRGSPRNRVADAGEVSGDRFELAALGHWGRQLRSRLLLGTARYPSLAVLQRAIAASGAEIVTVSLRRGRRPSELGNRFWSHDQGAGVQVLPNTAGCKTVKEAVTTAEMGGNFRNIVVEAGSDRRRLHLATTRSCWSRRLKSFAGEGSRSFRTPPRIWWWRAAGSGRLLDPDAMGAPIGSGQGEQSLCAADLARSLPGYRADRGRRHRQTVPRHRGAGNGLRRRAGQHRRRPRDRPGPDGTCLRSGRRGPAGYLPRRCDASSGNGRTSTPVTGTPFWHQS